MLEPVPLVATPEPTKKSSRSRHVQLSHEARSA